jgi:hypothetical protein
VADAAGVASSTRWRPTAGRSVATGDDAVAVGSIRTGVVPSNCSTKAVSAAALSGSILVWTTPPPGAGANHASGRPSPSVCRRTNSAQESQLSASRESCQASSLPVRQQRAPSTTTGFGPVSQGVRPGTSPPASAAESKSGSVGNPSICSPSGVVADAAQSRQTGFGTVDGAPTAVLASSTATPAGC